MLLLKRDISFLSAVQQCLLETATTFVLHVSCGLGRVQSNEYYSYYHYYHYLNIIINMFIIIIIIIVIIIVIIIIIIINIHTTRVLSLCCCPAHFDRRRSCDLRPAQNHGLFSFLFSLCFFVYCFFFHLFDPSLIQSS